jgi:DNA replication protein DnaC
MVTDPVPTRGSRRKEYERSDKLKSISVPADDRFQALTIEAALSSGSTASVRSACKTFLEEAANAILVGPNGVGKSTIARNIAHQAVLAGHTVLCTSAGHMLNELAGADGDRALRHRLALYARPRLLVLDEIGYLSYSNRHADLLFEIVSRRYQEKSTLITTNRPFAEWGEVFPNAACVVSLVDRLVHNAEIIPIEGESYRLKEAKERSEQRRKQRAARKTKSKPPRSPHRDD